jgi:hypothetical protein
MIPHESKAKLEKMAHAMCDRLSDSPCGRAYHAMYITGAQAAWKMATELAVKAERERINPHLEAVRRMIQEAYIKNWSEETLRALAESAKIAGEKG